LKADLSNRLLPIFHFFALAGLGKTDCKPRQTSGSTMSQRIFRSAKAGNLSELAGGVNDLAG
jgi:hypothetical protein